MGKSCSLDPGSQDVPKVKPATPEKSTWLAVQCSFNISSLRSVAVLHMEQCLLLLTFVQVMTCLFLSMLQT